ncbi:MAG: peptidoglycan DD-metalloendopeptidase family protein [Cyanobacteria bacterium P01_H01_bin.105]
MLGLALSVGATGVLFADSEATAAVGSFEITTSANSSESPQLPSVLQNRLDHSSVSGRSIYHTVEQGDSLWQIAKEHQVEVQDIKVANRISPDATLQVGQVIKVPSEELATPTLVSLLPGAQGSSSGQVQAPNLERLVSGISSTESSASTKFQQTEQSVATEEPSIVATEELTGDISLRSAGLVSQSDGFQADLKQLQSDGEIAEVPSDTVVDTLAAEPQSYSEETQVSSIAADTDALEAASAGYQVRPGDTVDDIAISLGITSDKLATANGLEDRDFIVAGETLSVPDDVANDLIIASKEAAPIEESAPELTASSSLNDFDGTRLSRLQSTVENRINAPSTLHRLRGGQGGALTSEPISTDELNAEAGTSSVEDPYTADLLAEVNSAQEINSAHENTPSAPENTGVLQASKLAVDSVVINPQFQGARLEARAVSNDNDSTGNPELLAAAPLNPSVYVSSPNPAAGQVVSPEMPILPSAEEYLPEAPDYFNGYIWPTRGTLTSGYGWRWGRMHRGIDVAGPVGTPIVSAAPGVVEKAGWNSGGYGNLVEVRHADGSMTRYAHNSRITVRAGQRVTQGQHIADMGSTGYSTGPHLHFEVHLPDRGTVNPMAMLPSN